MNTRVLIFLLIVLAALVGISVFTGRHAAPPPATPPEEAARLLPGLDVNAVAVVEVTDGQTTNRLARAADRWVVASLQDYPARFETVAENVRRLADLAAGQAVKGGLDYLADFGLQGAPADSNATATTVVTLRDAAGKELARLEIGKTRTRKVEAMPGGEGYPDGQYVRANGGPVQILGETLTALPRVNEDWIDRRLAAVPSADVAAIEVRKEDGTAYRLETADGAYRLADQKPDEDINAESAARLAMALQDLQCATVSAPAATNEFGAVDEFALLTRDGRRYTVRLGRRILEPDGRLAHVAVAYTQPPPPAGNPADTNAAAVQAAFEEQSASTARKADEENKALAPWTYVIYNYYAEAMTLKRDQVVKPKPPPAASTNAPPAAQS